MGENNHIKELDAFAKKYVKEIPQVQPSIDFTNNLMQKIVVEATSKTFKTAPLISKKGWLGIVILVITTLFLAFRDSGESNLNFPDINFSFFDKIQFFNSLDGLSSSNTTTYAFVFFGLMILIQFVFLKKYFDKKIL